MKVYQGSLEIVKKPNLEILNYKTDFGKGFYTTTSLEQAKKWTKIKRNRASNQKETKEIKQYISVFEYTENSALKILNFPESSEEWLKFIYKNRMSEKLLHNYDIVKGPVANDNLYAVLNLYETNYYYPKEIIERLMTYKLANQISFHTNKSLECLEYIETLEVKDE